MTGGCERKEGKEERTATDAAGDRLGRAGGLTGGWEEIMGRKRKVREEGQEGGKGDAANLEGESDGARKRKEKEEEKGLREILKDLCGGIKEIRKEIAEMRQELKEGKNEREEIRRAVEEMKRKGEEEKEKAERRMEEMEIKNKKREATESRLVEMEDGGGRIEEEGWKEKIRTMEMMSERSEREKRRRNIIIRGIKVDKEGNEGRREAVERLLKEIGAEGKVAEVRGIRGKVEGREMIWVRMRSDEEKRKVRKEKWRLGKRKEWIGDVMTDKERRIEWILRREAKRERKTGKVVRVGYMKMWIEGKCRRWNEREGKLEEEGRKRTEGKEQKVVGERGVGEWFG